MNRFRLRLRTAAFMLLLTLAFSFGLPCSALFRGHVTQPKSPEQSPAPQSRISADLPPVAEHQSLFTYRNVELTGRLTAMDPEGGPLVYQLTGHPARGSVALREDGSGVFVYTPYENKLGRDSFTFTARDSAGNVSAQGRVSIRIIKPDTRVTYADLEGHPAHRAAIRLAEEGLFIGEQVSGHYFFRPDRSVPRAEFLAMAASAVKLKADTPVALTGFHDNDAIPVWARSSVAAALKSGVISGSKNEYGAPVFQPEQSVTCGEALAMLNRLLRLPDAPAEVFAPGCGEHWAMQSAANLAASGLLCEPVSSTELSQPLTRADAARLLEAVLTVREGL